MRRRCDVEVVFSGDPIWAPSPEIQTPVNAKGPSAVRIKRRPGTAEKNPLIAIKKFGVENQH